jgi:hypothetical protein
MIEFVNLKDGRVFNGESPYVFWFDGGQSVNLNYVRKICFISTSRVVEAHIDSQIFSLLVMGQDIPIQNTPETNAEIINENLYMRLEDLKANFYTSVGYPYNDFYVHIIYILANSNEAGEIHDNFQLTDNDGKHTYEIAGDFYGDNEVLKINLGNYDVHIPESIQKAIYDVNVHEEANDNITLNRKYKELLMNYWDIIANKGSYNSLQNSLAWFEWGDLVRIEELWKRHHEGMEDYFHTKLNKELDYEFITEFLNNSKTTYIGLYMALDKVSKENGKIKFDDEGNPVLEHIIAKWQLIDLCLKMTLLGNFYSTYFVPIHIDVIHSTLEHWVFAYTIKVLHTSNAEFVNVLNNVRSFNMEYDKRVKMTEQICRNYSDTLFKNPVDNGLVFGFESEIRPEPNTMFLTTGEFTKYRMGGFYGIVHFKTSDTNPIIAGDSNDRIWHERVIWEYDGQRNYIDSYVNILPSYLSRSDNPDDRLSDQAFLFGFNLGFSEPGEYKLTFEFDTLYGNTWTKTITVTIEDNSRNILKFYKVVNREDTDFLEFTSDTPENWLKSFQVSIRNTNGTFENDVYTPYNEHSVFIVPFINESMGLNHTVIFDIPEGVSYNFDPRYIWITSKPANIPFTRAVGICREFGLSPEHGILGINTITINGQPSEPVMSYRFHPFMHTLIPILNEDDYEMEPTDLIYVVPQLGYSKTINDCNWMFTNTSTGEQFKSHLINKKHYPDGRNYGDLDTIEEYGGTVGWFMAPQTQVSLKSGYYDIKFKYLKGNVPQEYNVKSAFRINK